MENEIYANRLTIIRIMAMYTKVSTISGRSNSFHPESFFYSIADFLNILLTRLYPKLRTRFSLSGKNPGFLAYTFSVS